MDGVLLVNALLVRLDTSVDFEPVVQARNGPILQMLTTPMTIHKYQFYIYYSLRRGKQ